MGPRYRPRKNASPSPVNSCYEGRNCRSGSGYCHNRAIKFDESAIDSRLPPNESALIITQ